MWAGTLLALLLGGILTMAEDNARVPYEYVYKIQKTKEKLAQTYTNLNVAVRMKSRQPAVKVTDLDVYIETKTGNHPVLLGRNGEFTVPMRPDWVAENAAIVVNQPKGSMALDWNCSLLSDRMTNRMRYQELMRAVANLPAVQAEMARVFPGAPTPPVLGMKLVFPADSDAVVVLRTKNGERILKPGLNHAITIPLEQALLEENPEVWLKVLPEKAEVDYKNSPGG